MPFVANIVIDSIGVVHNAIFTVVGLRFDRGMAWRHRV